MSAQTKTWVGGTNATWDTAGAWNTPGEPSATDDAVFPMPVPTAPGATITLTSGETANSLTFEAAYTLTGGDLTLNPTGTGAVSVATGVSATIASALVGAGSPLTKAGPGTLLLRGTNTFTGPLGVTGGVLDFNAIGNLGAANTAINVADATIRYSGTARLPEGSTAAQNQHFYTVAGAVTFDVNAGGYEIFNPPVPTGSPAGTPLPPAISGTGTITKIGTSTLRFGGNNTGLSANWVGQGGNLEPLQATSLGTGTVTMNAGILAAGANISNAVTLAGGAISSNSGNRTYSGPITAAAAGGSVFLNDFFADTARDLTITGKLSGAGNLTVGVSRNSPSSGYNTGTLNLRNDTNDYAGTLTIQKNLTVNTAAADGAGSTLGAASVTLAGGRLFLKDNGAGNNGVLAYGNNVTVAAAAGFGSNAGGAVIDASNAGGTSTGNTFQLGTLSMGLPTLSVTGANGYAVAFAGQTTLAGAATFSPTSANLALNGGVTGAGSALTKNGNGTLTLGGLSDYTGGTTVNAGTLVIGGAAGRLTGTPSLTLNGGTALLIDNAAANVADRVADNIPLTLVNTSVTFTSTTAAATTGAETLGTVTVNGANNAITVNRGNPGAIAALTINNLIRSADAAVDFGGVNLGAAGVDSSRIILVGQQNTTFIGGWATVGTAFAGYSTEVDNGFARGVYAADAVTADPTSDAQFTPGANVVLTGNTTTTLTDNRTINTLSFANAPADTRTLNVGAFTLTLAGSGLSANGGGPAVLAGAAAGGLTAGTTASATDLFVTNEAPLAVSAPVRDNAAGGAVRLVKSGAGLLTLSGPSTYTGETVVNEGTLSVADVADAGQPSHLGSGPAGLRLGGLSAPVTFRFTGPTDATNRALAVPTNAGATVEVATAGTTLAWNGPVTATGPLTKTGPGTFTVGGTTNLGNSLSVPAGTFVVGGNVVVARDLNVGANGTGTNGTLIGAAGGTLSVGSGSDSSVNIGSKTISAGANTGAVDLSALTSFTADVGNVRVGVEGPNNSGNQVGSLILAQSNTITAKTAVTVGDSPGTGDAGTRFIRFGPGRNDVTTPLLLIGGRKFDGSGTIAPGGTLTLAAEGTARTTLNVGVNNVGTGTAPVGRLDLTGGSFVARLGPVTAGLKDGGDQGDATGVLNLGTAAGTNVNVDVASGNAVRAGILNYGGGTQPTSSVANGTITIGGGTVTIATASASSAVLLGNITVTNSQTIAGGGNSVSGTLNITGGDVTINAPTTGANSVGLAARAPAGVPSTNTSTGTLSISGGSLTVNAPIFGNAGTGQTSNLNLTGGLLNMQSRNITIGNVTFANGTLRNVGTLSRALTQTGGLFEVTAAHTGTATINGAYALSGGTASVAAGEALSIAGPLTVGSAGTLKGAGAVTVTGAGNGVTNAGTIAPGSSIGPLTITSPAGVVFGSGGTLVTELDNASADLLAIAPNPGTAPAGTLDLTAAGDSLVIAPLANVTAERQYTIATFSGFANGDPATNRFSNVFVDTLSGLVPAGTDPAGPNFVSVAYNASSIQVTVNNLSAVPEPASAGLAAVAAVGLLARRRRPGRC